MDSAGLHVSAANVHRDDDSERERVHTDWGCNRPLHDHSHGQQPEDEQENGCDHDNQHLARIHHSLTAVWRAAQVGQS